MFDIGLAGIVCEDAGGASGRALFKVDTYEGRSEEVTLAGPHSGGTYGSTLPTSTPARARASASVDPHMLQIDRYKILDTLGIGGMGIVLLAVDTDGTRVALKLGGAGSTDATEGDSALVREAELLGLVSHPNVIRVLETGVANELPFMAMEYIEGATLRSLQITRRYSWRRIVEFYAQAGRGLAALHDAGIIHCDVKPANILVGSDSRARVIDLGVARRAGEVSPPARSGDDRPRESATSTVTDTLRGTPAYMSPEQHDLRALTPASDQFSFCVALFEALYGWRPFAADSADELREHKRIGKIRTTPFDCGVPTWIGEAVLRGLSPDPADRWPSMEALVKVLEGA